MKRDIRNEMIVFLREQYSDDIGLEDRILGS